MQLKQLPAIYAEIQQRIRRRGKQQRRRGCEQGRRWMMWEQQAVAA